MCRTSDAGLSQPFIDKLAECKEIKRELFTGLTLSKFADEFNKQKSGTESSLSPFITEDQKKYLQVDNPG